ncbi:MAG TPA: hypothetical protein PLX23_02215 [Candidatus Hydrogenedens sp.]|nr:hypothetical protein [Candidatus Hydrogenedens sp.]
MGKKNRKCIRVKIYCFFISCLLFFFSCEVAYVVKGKVLTINGEPLPGVSVSSPETLKHVITDAKGDFVLYLQKPVNTLDFLKSDYLPMKVPITGWKETNAFSIKISLTPKPIAPGIYLLEENKNRYVPLSKGKVERIQIEEKNSIPAIKLKEPLHIKDIYPRLFVYRLPQYDLTLYKMTEYKEEEKDIIKEKKKRDKEENKDIQKETQEQDDKIILIPDEPILIHTEFLTELEPSLFVVRSINELKPGVYCLNWRAFEVPFPRMNDCFLFVLEEKQPDTPTAEISQQEESEGSSENKQSEKNNDKKEETTEKK